MQHSEKVLQWLKTAQPEHQKSDGSSYYQCPFCAGHRKLEVSAVKPVWYCHKCGMGGSLPRSIKTSHRSMAAVWTGVPEPTEQKNTYRPARPGSMLWAYLQNQRSLSVSLIEQLRPHHGPSPLRVYLPLYAYHDTKPVYFVGRSILPGFPRYWNPPSEGATHKKSDLIWGMHKFINGHFPDDVLVCEGIFDACHYPNGVALLGKTISPRQVELIRYLAQREITVCLDGDAYKAARKVAYALAKEGNRAVYLLPLAGEQDPDSVEDLQGLYRRRERIA